MWEIIFQPVWMLGLLILLVISSLVISLSYSMLQVRRLKRQMRGVNKELSVVSESAMGVGRELLKFERHKHRGEFGHRSTTVTTSIAESQRVRQHSTSETPFSPVQQTDPMPFAERSQTNSAPTGDYRKAGELINGGLDAESVMMETGVSKAEIELIKLLKKSNDSRPAQPNSIAEM